MQPLQIVIFPPFRSSGRRFWTLHDATVAEVTAGLAADLSQLRAAGVQVCASVDEIGDPKKSSGHYKVPESILLTLYSV